MTGDGGNAGRRGCLRKYTSAGCTLYEPCTALHLHEQRHEGLHGHSCKGARVAPKSRSQKPIADPAVRHRDLEQEDGASQSLSRLERKGGQLPLPSTSKIRRIGTADGHLNQHELLQLCRHL